jgi:Fe-S cluster assembly protein SufD
MSVEMKLRFDREAIVHYSKQVQEPDWMLNLRLQSLEQYEQLPLPKLEKTKIDKWNMDRVVPFVVHEQVASIGQLPEQVQSFITQGEEKALLIQRDGTVIFTSIPEEWKKQGVIFTSLQSALSTHGEIIEKHFMKMDTKADSHKLAALHTAAWSGGAFLYVPKNVELKTPVQTIFWSADEEAALFPHVVIVLEANSSVTYIENYVNSNTSAVVSNAITEVQVGSGARCKFASARTFLDQVTDYAYRHATVERDGRMEWVLAELNAGNSVSENSTHLLGNGSTTDSKLITISTGQQKENFVSRVLHTGKNTDSQVSMKGVVKDESTIILNGIGYIVDGAVNTNAEQEEKILMLSPKGRGDANPILLIDEDDVQAGHAASIGQVDPMQVYYLMSRGISEKEAVHLIVHGFILPTISEIPDEAIRGLLERTMERKVVQ